MTPQQAREFLKAFKQFPQMGALRTRYLEAISVLERSDDMLDQMRAELARSNLPANAWRFAPPTMVPLESHCVHRIWITGNPNNAELRQGVLSQPRVPGWTNLLWIYDDPHPHTARALNGRALAVHRDINLFGQRVYVISFRETMLLWHDQPGWIRDCLRYLDAMLPKRAYVAMGDIIRMVVLWFMGGLYVDTKILFDVLTAPRFFRGPRIALNRLICASANGRMENWAMMCDAGCDVLREVLWLALYQRLPSIAKIQQMPVNWSHPSGRYSQAHVALHEAKSVWPILQTRYAEQILLLDQLHPPLLLRNPRPLNSWAEDDGVAFSWD